MQRRRRCFLLSPHRVGASQRGHSLSQKRMAPLEPQEKDFDWQSQARMAFVPPEGDCLRAALPRLELLYDLPLLLSSAVAQPLAALLPYGCGTPLAGAALESERKCSVITCCRWHNIAASAAKPPRQTNSKSVQVQSRRKLRKANESQAKRQRR